MLHPDPQQVMPGSGLAAASGRIYGSRMAGNKDFFKSPQPAASSSAGFFSDTSWCSRRRPEHARRGDLLHVCAGQVRDWRPGRSGAPVRLVEPPPLTRPRSGSRGCRTGPVRRRTIGHSPGRCQASWAPIGMPAGIGPSWVCRLPATTSRRPVFRRRMQRHRTYGDDCGSNVESHTGRRFDIEGS